MAAFPKIPGYRINRLLGQGGMSNVYLAHDGRLDRDVAIKVLFDSLAEDRRTTNRFLHEAKTAARLQHSNIIHIYNVGRYRRHYYMVMELLTGSLKDMLESSGSTALFPEPGLSILSEIALALDYAHQQGVIHRDIKPDNIMFRNDSTPILVDFGISRCIHSNTRLTRTGMSIGTPHYMSPEQIRGKDVDGRSDLYSLGVVIFEMLTREVPYTASEAIAVAMKHVREPVPRLPESMAAYNDLIQRLMAKDAKDRPSSGREVIRLIDDLRKHKQQESIDDSPKMPGAHTTALIRTALPDIEATAVRPVQRFRKGLMLATTVTGLLLAGSAFKHTPIPMPAASAAPSSREKTPDVRKSFQPPTKSAAPLFAEKEKRLLALMAETRFAEARRFAQSVAPGDEPGTAGKLERRYNEILNHMRSLRRISLRAKPDDVTEAEARPRIKALSIFDNTWNSNGNIVNRFRAKSIHGHPVILDLATGLMWMRTGSNERYRYNETAAWIRRINAKRYAGFNNWRLPTIEEAGSLLEPKRSDSGLHISRRFDATAKRIWTTDTFPPKGHWYVNLRSGNIDWNMLGLNRCRIRPVRSIYPGKP